MLTVKVCFVSDIDLETFQIESTVLIIDKFRHLSQKEQSLSINDRLVCKLYFDVDLNLMT